MSEEIETAVPVTAEPVGDPIVKHCAMCGVQFRQMFLTNHFFKCGACGREVDKWDDICSACNTFDEIQCLPAIRP